FFFFFTLPPPPTSTLFPYTTLFRSASNPFLFVVFSAFTFFGWGEIFSLFPAICGDFFGRKHATANYGFLYTAKGTASVLVPVGRSEERRVGKECRSGGGADAGKEKK